MSILNAYEKVIFSDTEIIDNKSINSHLKTLYDNDVLLYDYVDLYAPELLNEYSSIVNSLLGGLFEEYNYFTLSGNDTMDMIQSSDSEYIYQLNEFRGLSGFKNDEMRYIWIICSSGTMNSGNYCYVYAKLSSAFADDYEGIFGDQYNYAEEGSSPAAMKGGSTNFIPIPIHAGQTQLELNLEKSGGTGYFRIIGASCIPNRI